MNSELGPLEPTYEAVEKLHESGAESIFKIRHRMLGETHAVRIVLQDEETDPELLESFEEEAQSTALLRHPNIAEIYELTVTPEGDTFIVTEYVEGVNLRALLEDQGRLPISQALEIAMQALEAIDFFHDAGFVHRNLSPEGIMFTQDAEGRPLVKLLDLGLVRALQDTQQVNDLGMFLGKTRYASPEQFGGVTGDSEAVDQSDLYSFGVILYELLTGELPIEGEDLVSFASGHLFDPPRSFAETDPEGRVPDELRDLVLWALAKDPKERPQSARQLTERLRSFQEQRDRMGQETTVKLPAGGVDGDEVTRKLETGAPGPGEAQSPSPHRTTIPPPGTGLDELTRPLPTAPRVELEPPAESPPESQATTRIQPLVEPELPAEPPPEPQATTRVQPLVEPEPPAEPQATTRIQPLVEPEPELPAESPPEPSPTRIQPRVEPEPGPAAAKSRWPWALLAAVLLAVVGWAVYQGFRAPGPSVPDQVTELVGEPSTTLERAGAGEATGTEEPSGGEEREEEPWVVVDEEPAEPPPFQPVTPGSSTDASAGVDSTLSGGESDMGTRIDPEADLADPGRPRSPTVRDPQTGLTWMTADNNQDVDWAGAKAFCESYSASTGTEWRLPKLDELEKLYDKKSQNTNKTRLGIRISASGWLVWSSDRGAAGKAACFTFMSGEPDYVDPAERRYQRALCVSGG